jgi:hypothetical protein
MIAPAAHTTGARGHELLTAGKLARVLREPSYTKQLAHLAGRGLAHLGVTHGAGTIACLIRFQRCEVSFENDLLIAPKHGAHPAENEFVQRSARRIRFACLSRELTTGEPTVVKRIDGPQLCHLSRGELDTLQESRCRHQRIHGVA